MKKLTCAIILSFCTFSFVKSQDKASHLLLLQTWKLTKFDTYIYTYVKQDVFDPKSLGLRFKKNGKILGNLNRPGNGNGILEDFNNRSLQFERYIGDWKKTSDSTVTIIFSSNPSMNGNFIISRLTESELKLKRLFDAATEKKFDSIRRSKDISY
ncbi:hypothetical protein [Chryseobacterium pennipullorum]|uniref:Lipocalin-like domain-containing protein n=1 Tax=Chryseobacterium pennipullorum TaxID=2258963 RepID=A0A3D9B5F2_9FLAO|nr:hypothetical protein [Chryseobacterium pennipullorum]REC48598.1 hypothetical protein DRF67_07200 [Chryseobacterium pennipullorum]